MKKRVLILFMSIFIMHEVAFPYMYTFWGEAREISQVCFYITGVYVMLKYADKQGIIHLPKLQMDNSKNNK